MKKVTIIILAAFFLAGSIIAQNDKKPVDPMQKAWMEYLTPGQMHKILENSVGKWKTVSKFWAYPGAEPQQSEGEAEFKMILGGRYLEAEYHGLIMGMPFQGKSIEGYDNIKKEFFSIWIDNMGTGIAIAYGKYDAEKHVFNYKGTMTDPVSGKDVSFSNIVNISDKNKVVFDMYGKDNNGKEFLMMKMIYTRK